MLIKKIECDFHREFEVRIIVKARSDCYYRNISPLILYDVCTCFHISRSIKSDLDAHIVYNRDL